MNLNHRESSVTDLPKLQKWVDADLQHKNVLPPEFWIPSENTDERKGTKCLAIENDKGVMFFLRLENVMRVYVQFPPDGEYNPEEMKEALESSFRFIAPGAKKIGYKEMIFNSVSKSLIRFFRKFGFTELKDEYGVSLQ